MNINDMSQQAKSVFLARKKKIESVAHLAGWEPVLDTFPDGTAFGVIWWEDDNGNTLEPEPFLEMFDPLAKHIAELEAQLAETQRHNALLRNLATEVAEGDLGELPINVWNALREVIHAGALEVDNE